MASALLALAAAPVAVTDEAWGGGFIEPELFAGTIYDSLKR